MLSLFLISAFLLAISIAETRAGHHHQKDPCDPECYRTIHENVANFSVAKFKQTKFLNVYDKRQMIKGQISIQNGLLSPVSNKLFNYRVGNNNTQSVFFCFFFQLKWILWKQELK